MFCLKVNDHELINNVQEDFCLTTENKNLTIKDYLKRRQRQPTASEDNAPNELAIAIGRGNLRRKQREKQLMMATLRTKVDKFKKKGVKKGIGSMTPRSRLKMVSNRLKGQQLLRLSNWQYQLTSEKL